MKSVNRFFMPRQQVFFDLLKELASYQRQMALLLGECFQDFSKIAEVAQRAEKLEHEADMKAHDLIDRLNKTFVTPFDREDLYLLAHKLDDVVDSIEDVIRKIRVYDLTQKLPVLDSFALLINQASQTLEEMVDHFQEQKRSDYLLSLKVKIHEYEDQGDVLFEDALQRLFREEKDPIAVIKWKDMFENLEQVMDQYQSVSDVMEGVIVKSS